jgi:CheY-like chemotaxis protein
MNETILLIEDDDIDVKAYKRVLKKQGKNYDLYIFSNGEEAIESLKGINGKEKIPYPKLVLLDLNTPKMNGIEFLKIIRNDADLRLLKVIVLTTSDNRNDIIRAYDYHVSGYIIKPLVTEELFEIFSTIHNYWQLGQYQEK